MTIAPYAPRFPFETWILPKRHESSFENASSKTYESLAKALKLLLNKSERVLDSPAYNLVIHTGPLQEPGLDHYHWHVEFMPKLTKTAGFEWGTGFYINPTPPEEAARFLREARVERTATGYKIEIRIPEEGAMKIASFFIGEFRAIVISESAERAASR